MRKPDPRLREKRHREILEAAAHCFAQHGFHQTSMQTICAEARLSAGAVYRYFESKDAIIIAIAAQERTEMIELLQHLREAKNVVDGLIEVSRELLFASPTAHSTGLSIEVLVEASRNHDVAEVLRHNDAELKRILIEILDIAVARGDIDPKLDSEAIAEIVFSLIDGLIGRSHFDPNHNEASLIDAFNALIIRFLRPPGC